MSLLLKSCGYVLALDMYLALDMCHQFTRTIIQIAYILPCRIS